jgi:ubiquinone/menaquinone biosynthesis C-methylase UbiE
MAEHDQTIRREFAKQAATFEDPSYSFADERLMRWIHRHVPPERDELVLDVAGGTGHMARSYARERAAFAVVLDMTREMLATGRREAEEAGILNVLYVLGDAAQMPLLDDAFDLVVCRFAVHHFPQPERQVAEMARVCRRGGRVAIVDLVAADEVLGHEYDRLERLRDPSHTRALTVAELKALMEGHGLAVVEETERDQHVPVERWLAQAKTPPETAREVRAEIETELEGGSPPVMRPVVHEGELQLTHRWAILVARKGGDGE